MEVRLLKFAILCLAAIGVANCSNVTTPSGSATPTATPTPTPTPTPFIFKVEVKSTWSDGSSVETTHGTCTIDTNSLAGGATNTCTVSVPEGQLYYSTLTFTLTVADDVCDIVNFQPYYYLRSVAAAYTAPGTTAVLDCSVAFKDRPIGCFGGAAREMAPSFPTNTGIIHFTEGGGVVAKTLSPGNSVRISSGENITNTWAANDKADPTAAAADYEANSMVHYGYMCRDKWYEPLYYLKIVIDEDDPTISQIAGW